MTDSVKQIKTSKSDLSFLTLFKTLTVGRKNKQHRQKCVHLKADCRNYKNKEDE